LKKAKTKNFLLCLVPFVGSGILLTLIQAPFDLGWLAWVGYVPFILACSPKVSAKFLAVTAYLVSLFYWLGNLYWIVPVTWLGWIAFCMYTALLWPALVFGVRFCRAKRIPLFMAVPILIVGAERLQGLFLGGFYWRLLGHSQYANITLIQISDIFGAGGVSFLVAMVNGLIAELIIGANAKKKFQKRRVSKVVFVAVVLAGSLVYGRWRINQSEEFIETGPVVAAVQSNVPQSVKDSTSEVEQRATFDEMLGESMLVGAAGAELIVWPETRVPAVLDKRILNMLEATASHRIYDQMRREQSKDTAYVLVGAMGGTPKFEDDWTVVYGEKYNSAFLYQPNGTQADVQYNKIHLVPFGEVVPFRKSAPWLYDLLMKFTPYDYDYNLDYGTQYTVFEMNGAKGRVYKFGVMICYEDTAPEIGRKFTLDDKGGKRVDWLVNISNDGWFVKFKAPKVYPSTELAQHTAICVFRAVENRVGILRSVNTGISCMIDSLGRIRNEYLVSSAGFPLKVTARTGISGWFADKMPIDKRITIFTRCGQWLDIGCEWALILTIVWLVLRGFVWSRNKGQIK